MGALPKRFELLSLFTSIFLKLWKQIRSFFGVAPPGVIPYLFKDHFQERKALEIRRKNIWGDKGVAPLLLYLQKLLIIISHVWVTRGIEPQCLWHFPRQATMVAICQNRTDLNQLMRLVRSNLPPAIFKHRRTYQQCPIILTHFSDEQILLIFLPGLVSDLPSRILQESKGQMHRRQDILCHRSFL